MRPSVGCQLMRVLGLVRSQCFRFNMAKHVTYDAKDNFRSLYSRFSPAEGGVVMKYLESCAQVEPPPRTTLEEFIARSDAFPIRFPIETARVKTLLKNGYNREDLEDKINSAYPVIHEKLLPLMIVFLHMKKLHGREKEKKLYESMNLLDFIDRLLKKRPITFVDANDGFLLRNGTSGHGGFDMIGHLNEKPNISIEDYMSYDEMKISALLSVSSKSFFINDGSRNNRGKPGQPCSFQTDGVIIGQVGPRFQRKELMEWQDCAVTPTQNTKDLGYGVNPSNEYWLIKEWGHLWDVDHLPTWEEAKGNQYLSLFSELKFNTKVYKARVQMTAEVLLIEAAHRASAVGLKAYVHVVGLGLGVWQITPLQMQLFVDAFGDALAAVDTRYIGHVDFSWIDVKQCHGIGDGHRFPNTNVIIHFSRRGLHAPVPSGMLLVDNFAWDSNSLPGNEYWLGYIGNSGDSAAASSSQVAELNNALINPSVTAENLHIVSNKGVEHISQYARRLLLS